MSNDWWSYESKDTYRAKQAQDWATKASKDALSYLAPTTTGVPPEALQQDPNSAFAPKPLITPQDDQGSSFGGFFKGIESGIGDIGKTAYDLTLKPINRVLEAEHNAIARPIAKTLLSPFGDYNKLPGIVRLGAETLTDPLTYIGPGEVMDAFKVAKLAPELKLGAPALQALFDSPGSRRLLTHIVTSGGLGLAAVGGNSAAQALGLKGLPAMAAGLGAAAIAGHAIGGSEAEVANAIKPSSADDLRTSMESARLKNRQASHIDVSAEANAKRLEKFGTPDDLMQRMYDQEEMGQLNKKIQSGSYTEDDLNRANELLTKADLYKQRDSEPPLEKGMVRMYRGEGDMPDNSNLPDWAKSQAGKWYTPNRAKAEGYSKTGIKYVDVPPTVAEATKYPYTTDEHILPDIWSSKANPLVDSSKSLGKFPPIGGGAAGSTNLQQQIWDRYNNAPQNVQNLLNVTTDTEAKVGQLARAGGSVWLRDNIGTVLEKGKYGQGLSDFLNSHGFQFHDTAANALVNEAGRIGAIGENFGNAMGTHLNTIEDSANKSGALSTAYQDGLTKVLDPDLIQQAKFLVQNGNLVEKDGSLALDTLVNHSDEFNLNARQKAVVDSLKVDMNLHRQLEDVFSVQNQGDIAHREPLSKDGYIKSGINSTQTFQRPQYELAGENGYLPYAEAQQARVQQGYHKIADSWLMSSLDGMKVSPSDLIPKDLVDQINSMSTIRNQAHDVQKSISNAILNETTKGAGKAWKMPSWATGDAYDTLDPQLKKIIGKVQYAANAVYIPDANFRKNIYQTALSDLKTVTDPIQAALEAKKSAMREIRSGIGSPLTQGMGRFQGNFYPKNVSDVLNRANEPTNPTGITKLVIDMNNKVRPIMATLDASFMGVQGLPALLSNPPAYMGALGTLLTQNYGDFENSLRDSGQLQSMLTRGIHWGARNDMGEFMTPNFLHRIPGIGKLADISDSAFTQFGNVLRSNLYKSVNWEGMTEERQTAMARTINLMTGFSPTNPSSFESAVQFAPRFFRSQMGLIADAVTKHDMGPLGAARVMSTMLTSGTALTYAANQALGQKTDFDPRSPNFLRVRVGGQDVSVFGTWDTLARAVTHLYTGGPVDAAEYLATAKASPVMSKMYDAIRGSTMDGTKLSWGSLGDILNSAATEAKSVLPISATQVASDVAKNPSDVANPGFVGGQALQFLGTKATPLSPAENMQIKRDTLAQQTFQKPWSQLEPYQQLQLHENNNVDLTPKSDLAKAFAFRRDISSQYQGEQESIDSQLPVGKDWIDAYHNLQREKVGGFAQWNKEHPDAAAQISVGKPKNANDAALQKFYQLFDQADKESWSPDELTQNVSDFQDSISPDQQAYIDRNTGLHDTARVKDYKADQKVLRPYWDIADTVYDRLKGRLPDADSASSLQDYTSQLIGKMQAAGVPDQVIAQRVKTNPVLSEITRATGALRQKYRQTHPQADKLLSRWYGYSQVAT